MSNYFNTAQLPLTNKAFSDAEKVVSRHFQLNLRTTLSSIDKNSFRS
jgi:hypothetical protein